MRILFIEACNYVDFLMGGQLSFAEQIVKCFNDELYLVGISTDGTPSGKWVKKTFNGISYNYFALHETKKITGKPLIPRRFSTYYHLRKYKHEILKFQFDYSMCCAPEVLVAIRDWGLLHLTYNFSGIENPLVSSRYWYGKLIKNIYDPVFYPALKNAEFILAAADRNNIEKVTKESKGILKNGEVIQFRTRIDMNIFRYRNKLDMRRELKLPINSTIIVSTSRLHWIKGWKLTLEAYAEYVKTHPNSFFYMLGDGASRAEVESFVASGGLSGHVKLLGFQPPEMLAKYLNAADLFVLGSFREGWSTALLEAKGSCVPLCVTNFSSAKDIVDEGVDGYVLDSRDPHAFAENMVKALALQIDPIAQEKKMQQYAVSRIKEDLFKIWKIQNGVEHFQESV